MSNKEKTKESEEVVDARSTQVAPAESTAVSTEVRVEGVRLDFPFLRIGQGMSQWRTPETRSGKPEEGAFYVGRSKESNVKVGEPGRDGGVTCIILDVVEGYKEDRPYVPGNNVAPKRWIVGAPGPDGNPMTVKDILLAAKAEGLTTESKETGEVWPDSGRPKMSRPTLSKFAYLMMLVPLPDTFDSDEYRLYPIGDRLYTTARFEFDKQYYSGSKKVTGFANVAGNLLSRVAFVHAQELKAKVRDGKLTPEQAKAEADSFVPTLSGVIGHLYSFEDTNTQGIQYTSHSFERAVVGGKPVELTPDEKADFVKFLMSVKAGAVSTVDELEAGDL